MEARPNVIDINEPTLNIRSHKYQSLNCDQIDSLAVSITMMMVACCSQQHISTAILFVIRWLLEQSSITIEFEFKPLFQSFYIIKFVCFSVCYMQNMFVVLSM